jgi:hypothetical protein
MAVKVEFEGYVNKVRQYDWGTVYDVSHNQVQKKDGNWEVVGRDYFSVVGPDGHTQFAENDMVSVKGTFKTKRFDKQDGSKGIALNVRAEVMEKLEMKNRPAKNVDAFTGAADLFEENAPF